MDFSWGHPQNGEQKLDRTKKNSKEQANENTKIKCERATSDLTIPRNICFRFMLFDVDVVDVSVVAAVSDDITVVDRWTSESYQRTLRIGNCWMNSRESAERLRKRDDRK